MAWYSDFVKGIEVLVKDPQAAHEASPISAGIIDSAFGVVLAPARVTYAVGGQDAVNTVARNPVVDLLSLVTQPTLGADGEKSFFWKPPVVSSDFALQVHDQVGDFNDDVKDLFKDFKFPDLGGLKTFGVILAVVVVGVAVIAVAT